VLDARGFAESQEHPPALGPRALLKTGPEAVIGGPAPLLERLAVAVGRRAAGRLDAAPESVDERTPRGIGA
jgi:hypothetical protein